MGTRFVILLIGCNITVAAQEISSLTVAAYLSRPIGARATGLSGVQVACADDPSAIFSNPACVGYLYSQAAVTLGVTTLSFGRSLSNAAVSTDLSPALSLGIGIAAMNMGTLTQRDVAANSVGTRTLWQGYGIAAAAYRLTSQSSIGLSGRILGSTALSPGSGGSGVALDIGYVGSILDVATLGISIQNLGFMMLGTERFPLPWMLRLGLCSSIPFREEYIETMSLTLGTNDTIVIPSTEHILVGIEAQHRAGSPTPTILVGIEVVPHRIVAIRASLSLYGEWIGQPQLFPHTMFGGGISLHVPMAFPLRIDYAISRGFTTPMLHTISIVAEL